MLIQKQRSLLAWWTFICGVTLGLTLGMLGVRRVQGDLAATVQATTKEVSALRAELANQKLADDKSCGQTILNALHGDGTRTILVDTSAAGGSETAARFLTNAIAARQYGPVVLGRAWVLPTKIIPKTTDGSLGFQYAWIAPDGKVDGWFQPQRAQ
jgi:hypothetical protein